jgi:hypothetical protein
MGAQFVNEKSALTGAESPKKHVDVKVGSKDGVEREWLGSWYSCFGDCGRASWLACCVTAWCPCVSSGRDGRFLGCLDSKLGLPKRHSFPALLVVDVTCIDVWLATLAVGAVPVDRYTGTIVLCPLDTFSNPRGFMDVSCFIKSLFCLWRSLCSQTLALVSR